MKTDAKENQAWKAQAHEAIRQGQSLVAFMASCHPDNRSSARKGYLGAIREVTRRLAKFDADTRKCMNQHDVIYLRRIHAKHQEVQS